MKYLPEWANFVIILIMNPQTVIFVGRSGAGKGVQAKLLQEFFKKNTPDIPVLYLETGSYFRKYIKQDGFTWDRARNVNDKGARQSDFIAVWIWSQFLIDNIKEGDHHIVFDGTPRSLNEAEILSTAIHFYDRKNPMVVFLDISSSCAEERLRLRGRADDLDSSSIERRQGWFENDVVPAIDYFRNNPEYNFLEIDGEQTPEEVHQEIVEQIVITE